MCIDPAFAQTRLYEGSEFMIATDEKANTIKTTVKDTILSGCWTSEYQDISNAVKYSTTSTTLSETKFLEHCVRGTKQNQNECINSLVRIRLPKHKHYSVKVIPCAVASAVLPVQNGAVNREKAAERLSIPANKFTGEGVCFRGQETGSESDLQRVLR